MIVAVSAAVIGLVAVLWAFYGQHGQVEASSGPRLPDWGMLPAPSDVARVEFPLSIPGYDPATVEVTLEALRSAYADLLAAADAATLARARARAALRTGVDPASVMVPPRGVTTETDPVQAGQMEDADGEALRTAAALDMVQQGLRSEERDRQEGGT